MHTRNRLCIHALQKYPCSCLTSLARYTQTMCVAWGPLVMFPVVGQRRHVDVWSLTKMSPNWCAHAKSIAYKNWLMLPVVDRCRLVDTCRSGTNSPSRCPHTIGDAMRPWLLFLAFSCDAYRPQSMSPDRWPHTMLEVTKSICTRHDRCMEALDDDACHWLMSLSMCANSTFVSGRPS